MKFLMTLLVFKDGERQGEIELLAEFPDEITVLNAVIQLGAANSQLRDHPDVKAMLRGAGPKSLARIHEGMGEGMSVQIKKIARHHEPMPEALRRHPNAFHIMASRPVRKVPAEGIVESVHEESAH